MTHDHTITVHPTTGPAAKPLEDYTAGELVADPHDPTEVYMVTDEYQYPALRLRDGYLLPDYCNSHPFAPVNAGSATITPNRS